MKNKINTGIRIILGIALVVFGSNKFLEFMPHQEMNESLMAAFVGLMATKFIIPTVAVVEMLTGASLIVNKYTNLALLAMFPVSYGMVAFHLAVDIPGGLPAFVIAALNVYLIVQKRNTLAPILYV